MLKDRGNNLLDSGFDGILIGDVNVIEIADTFVHPRDRKLLLSLNVEFVASGKTAFSEFLGFTPKVVTLQATSVFAFLKLCQFSVSV
jgi:hypothetical protein